MKKFKLRISSRLLKKKFRKKTSSSKKRCRFDKGTEVENAIDYKNVEFMKSFLTERGKILQSRVSGNCAKHQREVTRNIKLARFMGLIPFCSIQNA